MELISIIVPVYNVVKYLDRCISSIIKQSYSCFELILINDGSTDGSLEVCKKWANKDNRIVLVNQKNSGVSYSRNKGLEVSTGKYIIMVDSDDYICKNTVETLYYALKEKDADLAICDFEKGNEQNYVFPEKTNDEIDTITGKEAIERHYIDDHNALRYIAPWAKLYKKELFDNIEYPNGKIFEDIYVTHQILYRCKTISVVPQKLFYYFQWSDSIMNKKYHVGKLDYLQALKERLDFFRINKLEELASIAYDEYLHSLIWEYSRAHDLLADQFIMNSIKKRYREVYIRGYASKRYPNETAHFLRTFNLSPDLILIYWKVYSKLKRKE